MEKGEGKIEKTRSGRWKKTEHEKFMKAIEKYGKNWNQIQRRVPSRSLSQIRSHAQKIFLNMPKDQKRNLFRKYSERKIQFCNPELNHFNKRFSQNSKSQQQIQNIPQVKIQPSQHLPSDKANQLNQQPIPQLDPQFQQNMQISGVYPTIANGFGNFLNPFGGIYQMVPCFVFSHHEENKYQTLSQ